MVYIPTWSREVHCADILLHRRYEFRRSLLSFAIPRFSANIEGYILILYHVSVVLLVKGQCGETGSLQHSLNLSTHR